MLTRIYLEHFKCFRNLKLHLAPLTLLSGTNATGKSTILQALAILHQTIIENEWSESLILNSETTSLGTTGDVIDKLTGRREFKIGLDGENFESLWIMEASDRFSLSSPVKHITWREANNWERIEINLNGDNGQRLHYLLPADVISTSPNARQLAGLLSTLTYISADRFGPRETYSISSPVQHQNVGPRGERTPWFLEHFATSEPVEGLVRAEAPPTLQRQTEAWLQHFFPGASFDIQPVPNANLVTMGIRTSPATDFHRPQNVGYGLTHILPILAACLGAKEHDLIMVENPESHLHPSGQSEMGEFFSLCAASGLQIILETHSDHILNGIRRAVKKKVIRPEQVAIHFFKPRQEIENDQSNQVISPLVNQEGNLSEWPEDFFDQFDKDIDFLIGWES
jgi:predicted ATPase